MRSWERAGHSSHLWAAAAILALAACESDRRIGPPELPVNDTPTVRITESVPGGAATDYRVHFAWEGEDPDGEVVRYEYARERLARSTHGRVRPLDARRGELAWISTDSTAVSLFAEATTPASGDPTLQHDWNAFHVRAVDDHDARSEIASVYFDAFTIAPRVTLIAHDTHGTVACGGLTAEWTGHDADAPKGTLPLGYQMTVIPISVFELAAGVDAWVAILSGEPRENLLIPKDAVVADETPLGSDTYHAGDWYPKREAPYPSHTLELPRIPVAGHYLLALRAVDAAGAVTPPEDFSRATIAPIQIEDDPIVLRAHLVDESLFGLQVFFDGDERELEIPVGLPLSYTLRGQANYDCIETEVNWALNIPDPGCESCTAPDGIGGWIGWSESHAFSFTFESPGREVLWIKVRDTAGEYGEVLAVLVHEVVAFEWERPALLVDDYIQAGFNDCEHDAFLRPLVEHAVAPYLAPGDTVDVFEAHATFGCGENSTPRDITLSTLTRYETIFWPVSGAGGGTLLGQVTPHPFNYETNSSRYLAYYVAAGGNLVVWGRHTIAHMLGDYFPQGGPFVPVPPNANFGPGTFVWDVMALRTSFDTVGRGTSAGLSPACSGLVGLEATDAAVADGFPAGEPDPTGYDLSRTAIWWDAWDGAENPMGLVATGMTGVPPLHETGLDTLYTFVSNSWSYEQSGNVRDVCGSSFLSLFEGEPVATRYEHPGGYRGRVAWIGVPLYVFAGNHLNDLRAMMRAMADWMYE